MDVVIRCGALPKEDGFARIYDEKRTSGGSGANVLVTAAQLGAEAALVARIGDDSMGVEFRRGLLDDGVSAQYLQVKPGGITMYTYVFVADQGKRSIFVNAGDSFATLKPETLPESVLDGADVFFTEGYPTALPQLAYASQKRRIPIVFQLECVPSFMEGEFTNQEDLQQLLHMADIVCSGREAYAELAGENEAKHAMESVYRSYQPAQGVICTMGEQGSLWFDGKEMLAHAAYPVSAVDTTGAGDSFTGAMIYGYFLKGFRKREALQFANACPP